MKVFLGTNILFDILSSQREGHDAAAKLVQVAHESDVGCLFGTSQATDVYYSLKKALGDAVARDKLSSLFTAFELVQTPVEACMQALYTEIPDYEDAVQERVAIIAGCDWIATNDEKFLKASRFAKTPVELIRLIGAPNNNHL